MFLLPVNHTGVSPPPFTTHYICISPPRPLYRCFSYPRSQLTTLVFLVFIGAIQAVVVAIADIDARDAVAVVASKQVAETGTLLGLTVGRLVGAVSAVVVAVAVPGGRDAPVVRAPVAAPPTVSTHTASISHRDATPSHKEGLITPTFMKTLPV